MARRDSGHGLRRAFLTVLVLALLLTGGVAQWRYDAVDRAVDRVFGPLVGGDDDSGDSGSSADGDLAAPGPAQVAPPAGLTLPALASPAAVATPVSVAGPGPLDPAKVAAAIGPALADRDLGRHVLASVSGLAAGAPVFKQGRGTAIPASTTKLLTTVAALSAIPAETRFDTRTVLRGRNLVLVGGGDPLLASAPAQPGEAAPYPPRADVTTLAQQTATALLAQGVTRVRLGYDDTLFTGPAVNPAWEPDYVPDGVVAPITALWVDEGRPAGGLGRVADPSASAASVFASALAAAGVRVRGAPVARSAPQDATEVARVESAPVEQVVEHVLLVSDNEGAEVLSRQVGLAVSRDGSAAGGVAATLATLQRLGVATDADVVNDGSGLARGNRITPATLTAVLRVAATDPRAQLRTAITALPVAGFTGSLADRFADVAPAGRGRVRAKTGTLTGVTALAGIATDTTGHPMLFVLMADRIKLADTLDAREALDDAAAALGACSCGG